MSNTSYYAEPGNLYTVKPTSPLQSGGSTNNSQQGKQKDISQYAEIEQIYAHTLGAGFQTLSVLSPDPNCGCTRIACALAQRHADAGHSVLIVDVNLRSPALDKNYNLIRTKWPREARLLSELLPSLLQTVQRGIKVLTACINSEPTIKTQHYLESLITACQRQFDVIIFDTSPLNVINQHNIPAEMLAALTQASIIVLKGAETTEAAVRQATARLANNKVNLVGAVINDQSNPRLRDELIREASRLDKFFPRLANKLKQWITRNHFLNTAI